MLASPGSMRFGIHTHQNCIEHPPFFISAIVIMSIVCKGIFAVVEIVNSMYLGTGAYASVFLCGLLLLASLLTSLTLIGLAGLIGLPSLAGLTTTLATSTA